MEELAQLAKAKNLLLIEDAVQAHGAKRAGRGVASWSAGAATSLSPAGNIGALGDAGAVLTNSDELAIAVRALHSHLDALQAAVLCVKLPHLAQWNALRKEAAARYDSMLAGRKAIGLPATLPGNEHVWHLYTVRIPRRDAVLEALNAAGIGAAAHAPLLHLQGFFKRLGHKTGDFPVAERAAIELLSLPLYPEITQAQQERVVTELLNALG